MQTQENYTWPRKLGLFLFCFSFTLASYWIGYFQRGQVEPTERIVVQETVRTVTVEVEKVVVKEVAKKQVRTQQIQKKRVEQRKNGTVITETSTISSGSSTESASTERQEESSKLAEMQESKKLEITKNEKASRYRLGVQVNPLDIKELPSVSAAIRLGGLPVWVTGGVSLQDRSVNLGVDLEF